jgi:hypothetical protein
MFLEQIDFFFFQKKNFKNQHHQNGVVTQIAITKKELIKTVVFFIITASLPIYGSFYLANHKLYMSIVFSVQIIT